MKRLQINIFGLLVVLACMIVGAGRAYAQVDAQFTQYWAAQSYYNPAAIGLTDYIHITGGARLQWIGIENAPMSFTGMADMPVKIGSKRIGVGVCVLSESLGLYRNLSASAQVAYKFKLLGGQLGIGVQLGLMNEVFKGSKIHIPDDAEGMESTDEAIPQTDVSGNAFDMGAGVYYSHKYVWLAISAAHLMEPAVSLKAEGSQEDLYEFKANRMFYFMGGGNIPIKNTLFEILPSVFVKSDFKMFTAEATLRARFKKMFSAGVAYRWKDAVSLVVGLEIKNFFVGYSFDYPLSAINKASHGSHEVFLSYNVKLNLQDKNKNKHKSIRIL